MLQQVIQVLHNRGNRLVVLQEYLCSQYLCSHPLQQGPADSSVSMWKPKLEKGRKQTELKTTRRDHFSMLSSIDLELRCCSCLFSPFLKPVMREGVGMATCRWNVVAYSLGRVTDYLCPVKKKEGRAIEVEADQVKEEGNVIGAEGKIKIRYFFFVR